MRTWLVPGRDVLGEGIVIVLRGFIVEAEATPSADGLAVRATVTMLCTCPTEPGGLWDADRIDVRASLRRDGAVIAEVPLRYAGEQSTFEGTLPRPDERGPLTIEVTASAASISRGTSQTPAPGRCAIAPQAVRFPNPSRTSRRGA